MRILTAVATVALLASWTVAGAQAPAPAPAQSPAFECLCNLPVVSGSTVAAVDNIAGQVLLADGSGYIPVRSRTELSIGDRIVLLRQGRAVLTASPNCRVALTPGSVVSVLDSGGRACIAQAATIVPVQAPGEDDQNTLQQDGLFFLTSMAFGFAIAAAASEIGEDAPASP